MTGIGPVSPIRTNLPVNNDIVEGLPKENDRRMPSESQYNSSISSCLPAEEPWTMVPPKIENINEPGESPDIRQVEGSHIDVKGEIAKMGAIATAQTEKISELVNVSNKLFAQVSHLNENVNNLGFICGVQTIRLENLLNMSILDTIRTFLPKILGGLRRIDIANRRLIKAQLDKLAWVTQTVETYVKAALNPF